MKADEAQAKITENVLKLLHVRGYPTQQALGERIGKKGPELSKRIKGLTRWTLADMLALAEALDVEPGDMLRNLRVSIGLATGTEHVNVTAATGTDGNHGSGIFESTNPRKYTGKRHLRRVS